MRSFCGISLYLLYGSLAAAADFQPIQTQFRSVERTVFRSPDDVLPLRQLIQPADVRFNAADGLPWEVVPAECRLSASACSDSTCGICARDDACQAVSSLFYGYDSWRGHPDGDWANYGLHVGLNLGTPLGQFSESTGIGVQIGGSVGVYDWAGTDYRVANQDQPTTQGFVTYGLFRNADSSSNWSLSVVQDWMINETYSVMGEDSVLYQWRALVGYAVNETDEFGVWGAWRGDGDSRMVTMWSFTGPVEWQPHNQLNVFWHHKWSESLVDSWISLGIPERDRMTGEGTLGDWIAGVYATVPITGRLELYTMVNYMHQSASPGPAGAKEDAWNIYVGLAFYPKRLARSRTVRGHRWEPRLPVANNGLFLVDTSRTF